MNLSQRQKDIIRETLSLMAEKGLGAVTMKEIAKRFHVTDAALYKHFKGKKEILSGVATLFEEDAKKALQAVTGIAHPVRAIRAFFVNRCDSFAETPALALVLFNQELLNDDSFAAQQKNMMELHRNAIHSLIKKGQDQGVIRPEIAMEHLFTMIMGGLRLMVHQWKMKKYSFDLSREGRAFWDSIEALISPGYEKS